ncbi:hypothetical protein Poli38472_004417 [Pythium oligandrum]|uniref:EF-hand domain-containing protein n=1 Tax=Pythium oligandrum TaxID=41045 RepID=A0A8K1CAY2_PYTOL|nr:hypothetical protein Poli38472_004417 [Pythium oligandrum]|eukprot:TMW59348.1 hypothetical protein Poli38472_004417 [Pythium oligandrum]
MKVQGENEVLPRLHERKRAGTNEEDDVKFLGRMSWQKGLLDVHNDVDSKNANFSLGSGSRYGETNVSSSIPLSSPWLSSPWLSPSKSAQSLPQHSREAHSSSTAKLHRSVSVLTNNSHEALPGRSGMTFEESMAEVEQLLEQHVRSPHRQRNAKIKPLSTIQQSAERRDSTKSTFVFAPLRDPEILVATADVELDEEGGSAGVEQDESNTDQLNAEESSVDSPGNQKYFGATAKAAYYKTYKELHGKPHLFVETPKKAAQLKSLKTPKSIELRKSRMMNSIAAPASGSHQVGSPIRRPALQAPPRVASSSALAASVDAISTPPLHSPRVVFLSSCIAKSHPAMSLVLRRENCRVFDFSHQGLGDEFIIEFAAALPDLPLVEAIDVSDNRLSDDALNELINALDNKPNLIKLDISQNEIGRKSARSLRKYVSSSMCTLKTVTLNNADIDDQECTLFMIAFEQNKSVERLFMRSNTIGQTRKSMALGAAAAVASTLPSDVDLSGAPLPAGGDAIASMLNVNLNIRELDLSWNVLRYSSCAPIAHALQLNYNLHVLNLSYNGCADHGAIVLGNALRTNSALRSLNVSYNSVGMKGGLALASGLIVNKGLTELILDGNPIGLESGRELMHASCSRIHTQTVCRLSMFECNLHATGRAVRIDPAAAKNLGQVVSLNVYNPSDPVGKYHLDLSDPYEHMIAHELLRLATFKSEFRFAKLEYTTATTPKVTTRIELHRKAVAQAPPPPQEASIPDAPSPLALLFTKIDTDKSGFVDPSELKDALEAYGIHMDDGVLTRVLQEYDYDHSGALGMEEFEDFLLRCGFAMIDTNHSGALDEEEIANVLRLMGFKEVSQRELRTMINQYDLNNSGEIDEQEFIEFMKAEVLQRHQLVALRKEEQAATKPVLLSTPSGSLDDNYERVALRDVSGVIWKVPTSGFLFVDFVSEMKTDGDEAFDDPNDLSSPYLRRKPRASHLIADIAISKLLNNIQNISNNSDEQSEFFQAVLERSNLFFTAHQAEGVLRKQGALKSWPRKLYGLSRILPQMVNRYEAMTLVNRVLEPSRQWQQRQELRRTVGKLFSVLLGSVTNRYRIDLHVESDRVLLKKLAVISQEEKQFSKNRSGRRDTSQNGNWENFRNAKLDGVPYLLTTQFVLNNLLTTQGSTSAERKFVEFDYISTTRPPRGMKCLTTRRFDQLVEVWTSTEVQAIPTRTTSTNASETQANSAAKNDARLRWAILRNYVFEMFHPKVASTSTKPSLFNVKSTLGSLQQKLDFLEILVSERWFNGEQASILIEMLPNAVLVRAQAAALLFARLIDLENFITIYDSLSSEDQRECIRRLGWLNIFDPTQPDRQYPPLDLSVHDERELVMILSQLALQEGRQCWRKASYRASFDGEFAYKVDELEHHNAALVRGKGYEWVTSGNFGQKLERTGCLSRNQVPPLHLLTRLLRMATLESNGSIRVQFAGEIYRIRREDGASSRPTKAIVESDDVLIELSPTSLAPGQPLPDFVDQIPDLPMCPVLFESLADDSTVSLSEQLAVDENVTSATSCTCEATRNCLFIHGIGVHDDRGLVDAYPEYWGDIQRSMPCCSVVKFTHLNTVDSAWFSGLFAQRLCDALTATATNGTFVLTNDKKPKKNSQLTPLKNLIVVAHSTGNLHLASAFLHNECSLDSATSKWIAIQGPMRGTNTANRVVEECNKPASTWDKLVQTVVHDFELCPVKNSTKSLVLKNTPVSPGCLNTLYDKATRVYNERVNASLCGVSPFGLTSTSSPKFVALAAFSNHSTSENDGVVAFESCLSSARDYQTTYRSAFYKASINHDDGRLIHGDGVWGEGRKPIKWLQCQT